MDSQPLCSLKIYLFLESAPHQKNNNDDNYDITFGDNIYNDKTYALRYKVKSVLLKHAIVMPPFSSHKKPQRQPQYIIIIDLKLKTLMKIDETFRETFRQTVEKKNLSVSLLRQNVLITGPLTKMFWLPLLLAHRPTAFLTFRLLVYALFWYVRALSDQIVL